MGSSLDKKMAKSRRLPKKPNANLNEAGGYEESPHQVEQLAPTSKRTTRGRKLLQEPSALVDQLDVFSAALNKLLELRDNHLASSKEMAERRYSYGEIEMRARDLHRTIWQQKDEIWFGEPPANPIEMLDPLVALRLSGFECDFEETLGQFDCDGKLVETAGMIDRASSRVRISRQFDRHVQNFTAAHELGHALLHQASGLHRDRPLDGSSRSQDVREMEADKFATFFLMPEKLVKTHFKKFFLTEYFSLNEETAHALGQGDLMKLRKKVKTLRQLSRTIASAEKYNGVHFKSLANQFHVSTEAMAIRLEELELLAI